MAQENDNGQQQVQQSQSGKTAGKMANAGKPELGNPVKNSQHTQADYARQDSSASSESDNQSSSDQQQQSTQQTNTENQDHPNPPNDINTTLSTEQVEKFFRDKGVEFESVDDLLSRVANQKPKSEEVQNLTDEQKQEQESKIEKQMLDLYVQSGGKVEDFVAFKTLATADLAELSRQELVAELKGEGFSDDEITEIIKDRYFQFEDADIDEYEDESVKASLKKKKEYGAKKLANRSLNTQNRAKEILAGLRKAIEDQGLSAQEEAKFSSKVEEHFSKMPRKFSFQLGKVNDQDVDPIEYEINDDELAEVKNLLKDPTERDKYFFTEDGSLNISNLANVLLRNRILETAVKKALLEGQAKEVEKFEKVFPSRSPHDVGVGGNSNANKQKGKFASYGKPQVASSPK